MRIEHTIVAALTVFAASCGGYSERYPSYEAVVAQYAGAGLYAGEPLDAANAPDCDYPSCPCPRIWYDAHWVYYCDDRWVYWHHDCWYYYPVFYVYYIGGIPYVVGGPTRHITREPLAGGHGRGRTAWPSGDTDPATAHRSRRDVEVSPRAATPPDRTSGDSSGKSRPAPRRR